MIYVILKLICILQTFRLIFTKYSYIYIRKTTHFMKLVYSFESYNATYRQRQIYNSTHFAPGVNKKEL